MSQVEHGSKTEANYTPIRVKLLSVISGSILVIIGSLIAYNTTIVKDQALKSSRADANYTAKEYAKQIQTKVEKALDEAHHIADVFSTIKDQENPLVLNRDQANTLVKTMLMNADNIYGIYLIWEPYQFDGLDDQYAIDLARTDTIIPNAAAMDTDGRYVPYWFFETTANIKVEPTEGYGQPWYEVPKLSKVEMIVDPQNYTIQGKQKLLLTLEAPILNDGRFYGLTGVDIAIDWLQERIKEQELFEGEADISIISANGTIAATSLADSLVGRKFQDEFPQARQQFDDLQDALEGEILDDEHLEVYVPILIGETQVPWQVHIKIPANLITAQATTTMWRSIWISSALLFFAFIIIWYFINKQVAPLRRLMAYANRMAEGDISRVRLKVADDEIGQLKSALDYLSASLGDKSEFAEKIGFGDLKADLKVRNSKDVLGNSLLEMRDNLISISKRDEQLNWVSKGVALFSELLRENSEDVDSLSYDLIKNLVKYINANQGGIFVHNPDAVDDKVLELKAAYAWSRKKFIQKRLKAGEGLAGQCFRERKSIYLENVPESYVQITSGIGEASPRVVLISPMIFNDQVTGVIEIAGFKPFGKYEIEFVERIGESIGAAIVTTRSNQENRELLMQARKSSEEAQAQEEELRQNMEELQATQEEMGRKSHELTEFTTAVNNSAIVFELDNERTVLKVNGMFTRITGLGEDDLVGKQLISALFGTEQEWIEKLELTWTNVMAGNAEEMSLVLTSARGVPLHFAARFVPIYTMTGAVRKIMVVCHDITRLVVRENNLVMQYKQQITELEDRLDTSSDDNED